MTEGGGKILREVIDRGWVRDARNCPGAAARVQKRGSGKHRTDAEARIDGRDGQRRGEDVGSCRCIVEENSALLQEAHGASRESIWGHDSDNGHL